MEYIKNNWSEFAQYVNLDLGEHLPLDDYLCKIGRPNQEVGEFVLNALANVLDKSIKVYVGDCLPRVYLPCKYDVTHFTSCVNILY